MGRARRELGTVKLDVRVIADAKAVAGLLGLGLADYLSLALAPVVARDLDFHARKRISSGVAGLVEALKTKGKDAPDVAAFDSGMEDIRRTGGVPWEQVKEELGLKTPEPEPPKAKPRAKRKGKAR